MKKLTIFLAGLGFAGLGFAATPLVTPAELEALLGNPAVRVIDVRTDRAYADSHIPGALSAPYGNWRGPASNPGELPPLPQLTTRVQSLGLTPATHAVVVSSGEDSADFGAAARVYWTLKVLGLKNLSILNGGEQAWSAAALPQDKVVPKVAASAYAPKLDQSLIASRDQVASRIDDPQTRLVDARPAAFFLGNASHPAAKAAGTIRNAVNLDNGKWFKPGTAIFLPLEDAKRVAALAGITGQEATVSFCNTGHLAATNWFAMSEVVGLKNVALYPGSMVDWTQASPALPMDNAPGRDKIANDAKN
ncbi:sulfurtransferase [Herminiimonas sp. CN]|uniref:sulfurtransferase n=1 Tax=Herminiimonas sp. CN TaxID=1349818 RepID=UPI00055863FB|nr:rhodanese-like domain-containing protein [Herminiimonas sp. CN]